MTRTPMRRNLWAVALLAGCAAPAAEPTGLTIVRPVCYGGELLGFEIASTGVGVTRWALDELPGCLPERPTALPPNT